MRKLLIILLLVNAACVLPWTRFVFGMLGGVFLLPGVTLIALMLFAGFCLWQNYRWSKFVALIAAFVSSALYWTITFNGLRDPGENWSRLFTGDLGPVIGLPLVASTVSLVASLIYANAKVSA